MRWRPKLIFGYPNSLMLMAVMAAPQEIDLRALASRGLAAICTTSEMLTDVDRRRIRDAFGVPVFDSYGLREIGIIGHECRHEIMHTNDEQLILETIDPRTLQPSDGEGELVVTSIYSTVMPMIRYRTGDIVSLSSRPCECGVSLNHLSISGGRVADFVVTSDGRWIPGYAFIYICRSIPGVIKFQVRQSERGRVDVVVATDEHFPSDGRERVAQQTRNRLQSDDEVTVEVVDEIQPAPSGKYRPVVSRVAEQELKSANRSAQSSETAF
jgi:phenylacetate-CoA ligase